MAQIVCPSVSAEDRTRLEAIAADRNRGQKHVARARIILASAERLPVAEAVRRAGVGRPAVWRWQRRFAEDGVDGLLRDTTRKPGKAPLGDATVRRVVTLTCAEPPSVVDLQAAIHRYIAEHNADPKPFNLGQDASADPRQVESPECVSALVGDHEHGEVVLGLAVPDTCFDRSGITTP